MAYLYAETPVDTQTSAGSVATQDLNVVDNADTSIVEATAGVGEVRRDVSYRLADNVGGRMLLVGGDGFASIQAAVDAAQDGDTIIVAPGTYEETVTVNKDVTLLGANHGTAGKDDSRGDESTITGGVHFVAGGEGATLDGFEVSGASDFGAGLDRPAGVLIGVDGITVTNNVLTGSADDTRPFDANNGAQDFSVDHNLVTGWSQGAYIVKGSEGSIEHNLFKSNGNGVLTESTHVDIANNTFSDSAGAHVAPLPDEDANIGDFVHDNAYSGEARPITVYLNGGDEVTGSDAAETIHGEYVAGPVTLHGGGGDDRLIGGVRSDTLDGGDGNDVIEGGDGTDTLLLASAPSNVAFDGAHWTVTSADGADKITGVEIIDSGGANRTLLVGGGGFATIQEAIDAASDGDTIIVADGTFDEDLNIDKAVTILGAHAGEVGIAGTRDATDDDGETNIIGHARITASGPVTIDGVRFVNDVSTTLGGPSNPTLYVGTAFNHVITNSIFYSTVKGGVTSVDDRAIMLPALSGTDVTITVSGNLISGGQHGAFSDASWGRGIWSDGGDGITLVIADNTIEYSRSGINADMGGSNILHIEGNTFNTDGTGIATGVDTDGLSIADNTFHNVGTDFNFRNLTSSVTFDAQAAIDTLASTGVAAQDTVVVLGGSGADTIKGTAGADYIDGNNHPSQGAAADADDIDGRGGDDFIYGRGGNDMLKGGDGSDHVDGGDGDDTVAGGGGSDNLEGGAGTDTAFFEHDIKEYAINLGPNGIYSITRGGDTDFVHGFENFQFAGGPVIDVVNNADQLLNTHNPVFSSGATARVDENKTASTVVYDANATDADTAFGKIVYTLGGADALLLNIDSVTGEVRLNAPANFEAKNSYTFNVIATQEGTTQSATQAVTLSIDDLAEAPIGSAIAGINVEAGLRQASLAPLGLTGAVDPDGDPLTYKVTTLPTSGALFVNGVQVHLNDVLTAAQFAALTYSSPETAGTYALAFDASDGTSHTVVNVNLNVGSGLGQSCSGDAGSNRLDGGAGHDVLDGKAGGDVMIGGTGDDVFIVDNAGDIVDEVGGNGIDLVRSSVSFSLAGTRALGSVEQLVLTGSSAISGFGNALNNAITGNSAANTLRGGAGNDVLFGNAGNDRLFGDAGNDVLKGGIGNDILHGGIGNDSLYGGTGRDFFDFTVKPSSANADRIADFRPVDDTIRLDNAVMTGLGRNGTLSADKFHVGAHAHDASDRVIYDAAHGKLLYDSNGWAAGGEVLIATLGTGLHMTYQDIVVI